jgi:hypothetical protein
VITEIHDPVATVEIRWVSAADGGRRCGPPTAPVYVTTCVFPLGGEAEVQPGWPLDADPMVSILIQRTGRTPDGADLAKIDFLFPDLAVPHIHVGADILVLEGPKPVARAVVREVLRPRTDRSE